MNLLEVLTSVNGQVKGAAEYVWDCFGPNAHYLDVGNEKLGHLASVIFDSDDGVVYAIEMFLPSERRAWRWVDPRFYDSFLESCQLNRVNYKIAYDSVEFEDADPIELIAVLNELTQDPTIKFEEDDEEDDPA